MRGDHSVISFPHISQGFGIGQSYAPVHTTINNHSNYHYLPPPPQEQPPSPSSTAPFLHDPDLYVARPDLSDQIRTKLRPKSRVALVGVGGSGYARLIHLHRNRDKSVTQAHSSKTQLAIEHAQYIRERSPGTWVLWLYAHNAARFEQSVRNIAEEIKILGRDDENENIFELFWKWLIDAKKGKWLMVLDSADDASFLLQRDLVPKGKQQFEALIDYLPDREHGSILITTQSKSAARTLRVFKNQMIDVRLMDEEQARKLLEKKLGIDESENYGELAKKLEYIPLAMAQAAAYIDEMPRCSVEQYLSQLEESRASRTNLLQRNAHLPDREYAWLSSSILLTWTISFEHVAKQKKSAADLLSIMSFCDRSAIPEVLMRKGSSDSDSDFDDDVALLQSFSFISSARNNPSSWDMHGLVQDATLMWLKEKNTFGLFQGRFLRRLSKAFPADLQSLWPLMPHALAARSFMPKHGSMMTDDDREGLLALSHWSDIMYFAACHASLSAQYTLAEQMARESLNSQYLVLEMSKDSSSESTIPFMVILVHCLRSLKRYGEANSLQVEVVEMSKRLLGNNHSTTMENESLLAMTYADLKQFDKSGELFEDLKKKCREELPPNDPATISIIADQAATYRDRGLWSDAEPLAIAAVEMSRREWGPVDLRTLEYTFELSHLYLRMEDWEASESWQLQVVKGYSGMFEENHPWTIRAIARLEEIRTHVREQADAVHTPVREENLPGTTSLKKWSQRVIHKSRFIRKFTRRSNLETSIPRIYRGSVFEGNVKML